MAGEFQAKIERISSKAQLVVQRYGVVVAQRDETLKRVAELEAEARKASRTISELQQRLTTLQMAVTVAPDRQQVAATRKLLAELVRDIDKCIAQLTQ